MRGSNLQKGIPAQWQSSVVKVPFYYLYEFATCQQRNHEPLRYSLGCPLQCTDSNLSSFSFVLCSSLYNVPHGVEVTVGT